MPTSWTVSRTINLVILDFVVEDSPHCPSRYHPSTALGLSSTGVSAEMTDLQSGDFVLFPAGTPNRTLTVAEGVQDTCAPALTPLFNGNFTDLLRLSELLGSQYIVVPDTKDLVDVLVFPTDAGFQSVFDKLGITADEAFDSSPESTELLEELLALHVTQAVNINATDSETISRNVISFVDGDGNPVEVAEFPNLSLVDGKDTLILRGPENEIKINSLVDCNEAGRPNRKFVVYTDVALLPKNAEGAPEANTGAPEANTGAPEANSGARSFTPTMVAGLMVALACVGY